MQNAVGKLLTYVQQWPQGTSGVVYCLTRKETEEVIAFTCIQCPVVPGTRLIQATLGF